MKMIHVVTMALLAGVIAPLAAQAVPPTVSSVTATQMPGTKDVAITYTLSDPDSAKVTIAIAVSKNSGATWDVPASTFQGDYGEEVSVAPANKSVTWKAGDDWDGHYTTNCRVRVVANDMGLCFIPGGSFQMGDALKEGASDQLPVHSVFVSAFYMEPNEVTGGRWNYVIESYASSHGYYFANAGSAKLSSHPVHSVNWYDAVKWCNARSEMDGLTPVYYTNETFTAVYKTGEVATVYWNSTNNGWRLPTEAGWEKAARGGLAGKRFPWGDTISHAQANYHATAGGPDYDLSKPAGYHPAYTNGPWPYTSPVGSFAPNGYGLCDVAGNVWEWCWDRYGPTYYVSSEQSDPKYTLA